MARKPKKEIKTIEGNFIAIQQRLFDCPHLDIYHINIIAWIASYQRQDQPFFMSKVEIAQKFGCNKRTVLRRFEDLEEWGVVFRAGKWKRSIIYKVNAANLDKCLRVTHLERKVTESHSSKKKSDSEYHYNTNNKTSTKTSLEEEDDILSSSSSKAQLDPIALAAWASMEL